MAHDLKDTTLSVKHAGGNVVWWACTAARGTRSMVFINEVTAEKVSS